MDDTKAYRMKGAWLLAASLLSYSFVPVSPISARHLHSAAYQGDVEGVRYLVSQGANIDERDSSGVTALHYAAQMGHIDVIELLISEGADISMESAKEGNTPLHLASGSGHLEAARLLLDNGAHIDSSNNAGKTPLHWAAENGRTEIVEFLPSRGANLDTRGADGLTPLHRSVIQGYDTIVDILIEKGASPNAIARNGASPMRSALRGGFVRIARLLRLAGAGFETRKELVRFVQNQLWLRGYGITEMDGIMQANTVSAIREYQRHAGLAEDGVVSVDLADHLASSGEIDSYLSGERRTVTNIFVSWYDLFYRHGWEPGFLWSQAAVVGEATHEIDRDFLGSMKYEGHVRFGDLEIDGGVWILPNGWLIGHGSKVVLHTCEESPTTK